MREESASVSPQDPLLDGLGISSTFNQRQYTQDFKIEVWAGKHTFNEIAKHIVKDVIGRVVHELAREVQVQIDMRELVKMCEREIAKEAPQHFQDLLKTIAEDVKERELKLLALGIALREQRDMQDEKSSPAEKTKDTP